MGIQSSKSSLILQLPPLEQSPKGPQTITPGDFLSLIISAPAVSDGHLIDTVAETKELNRHFNLKIESIGLDIQLPQPVGAYHLEPCFHIR